MDAGKVVVGMGDLPEDLGIMFAGIRVQGDHLAARVALYRSLRIAWSCVLSFWFLRGRTTSSPGGLEQDLHQTLFRLRDLLGK